MKLKEQYNKQKSKYDLPDYDEINLVFEVDDIDPDSTLILQNIRGFNTMRHISNLF